MAQMLKENYHGQEFATILPKRFEDSTNLILLNFNVSFT